MKFGVREPRPCDANLNRFCASFLLRLWSFRNAWLASFASVNAFWCWLEYTISKDFSLPLLFVGVGGRTISVFWDYGIGDCVASLRSEFQLQNRTNKEAVSTELHSKSVLLGETWFGKLETIMRWWIYAQKMKLHTASCRPLWEADFNRIFYVPFFVTSPPAPVKISYRRGRLVLARIYSLVPFDRRKLTPTVQYKNK